MTYRKLFAAVIIYSFLCASALAQGIKIEESYGNGSNIFSLATGSPGELGLLKLLGENFAARENARLNWVKAGSGASLKLLQNKQVDMVMVHAPAAEKQAVAEGWATKRTLIGSNEFFIVGPPDDLAGIAQADSAADAYARIAKAQAKFYSRGDNSGTHKKELDVWNNAGITPAGDWYIITNDFMTATLRRANSEGGYFMTDSSTWVAESRDMPNLKVLFSGDKFLVNTYNAMVQPEGATAGAAIASKFIDFVASEAGQNIIRTYGVNLHGAPLYNDAAYAKQYDD